MNYKEIANRITGISCPIFGIAWDPPKREVDIAEKVITFLEDKRVLYNPYQLEVPKHCLESVIKIREFLTKQLCDVNRDSELGKTLRGMRLSCRKFLDSTHKSPFRKEIEESMGRNVSMGMSMEFYSGIGELRGVMGVLISKLLVMYGIDCESDLLNIIPIVEDLNE